MHFFVWKPEKKKAVPTGKKVQEGFSYSSGNNTEWLSVEDIRKLLKEMGM